MKTIVAGFVAWSVLFIFAESVYANTEPVSLLQVCTESKDCKDSEYCRFPEGQCGETGKEGTCVEQPQMCTMQYDPVCGCDGQTYSNNCAAAEKGISIKANGECPNS